MAERNKGKRLSSRYIKDYTVFDLETTGINIQRDTIIEISAVKVKDHEIVDEFTTLVNPGRSIPAGATAVNGITDGMVADAPYLAEAIGEFLTFIGDDVLVGHNIHTFDTNFAYDAAWHALGVELRNDYIDTLFMARKCLPKLYHHKLTDLAEYFGITTKGAHRALFDCRMNQACYEEMGKLMEPEEESEKQEEICPVCGCALVLRKGKFGQFYGCSGFPNCRFTRKIKR